MNQIEECIEAFNKHLKTKNFEHFSILLYDNNKSSIEQKQLLYKILFEDHKSIINWSKYIDCTIQTFPDRKLQLQRLINKSLEFLNAETEIKSDVELYQKIMSQLSRLKSSETSSQRISVNSKSSAETINSIPSIVESQELKTLYNSNPTTSSTIIQSTSSIDKKSNNLSKYIDSTLLNFNPKALRKASSSHQSSSNNNATKMLTSSIAPPSNTTAAVGIVDQSVSNKNNSKDSTDYQPNYSSISRATTLESGTMDNNNNKNNTIKSKKVFIKENVKENAICNKTPVRKQLFSIDDVSPSFVFVSNNSIPPPPLSSVTKVPLLPESTAKSSVVVAAHLSNHKQSKCSVIPSSIEEDNYAVSVSSETLDALNGSMSTTIRMTLTQSNTSNEDKNILLVPSSSSATTTTTHESIHDKHNNKKVVSFQPAAISSLMDSNNAGVATSINNSIYSSDNISPKINNILKDKESNTKETNSNQSATFKDSNHSNNSNSIHSNHREQNSSHRYVSTIPVDKTKGLLIQNNILDEPSRRIELNGKSYTRLNVLGKGGSSLVYRIIGNEDGQIYAYKRVEVRGADDMNAVFDNYANEIALLKKLRVTDESIKLSSSSSSSNTSGNCDGRSRIIELIDYEVCKSQRYVAMLLEPGDIDLAKVLSQKSFSIQSQNNDMLISNNHNNSKSTSSSSSVLNSISSIHSSINNNGIKTTSTQVIPPPYAYITSLVSDTATAAQQYLDPFFARMVWREMLEAVDHIHKHRIVHGDLKPANFVFVKGHLKLIDFGIAKSFSSDTTNIYRETQIGTINYMAPEAIAPMSMEECEIIHNQTDNDRIKMRLGRASDIWSLGCILYQMIYGRPPFAALNTIQKLTTIPNPKHVIKYNDCGDQDAIDSIKACLIHDPRCRSPISGVDGLLCKSYLQIHRITTTTMCVVNHNTNHNTHTAILPTRLEQISCQTKYTEAVPVSLSIDENKLQSIVSAVLDSLNNIAEESLVKLKLSNKTTGVSTRRGTNTANNSNNNQAMERVMKDVIKWIDDVNQSQVECEVIDLIQQQDWWKQEENELNSRIAPNYTTNTINTSSYKQIQSNDILYSQEQQIQSSDDAMVDNEHQSIKSLASKRKLEVLKDMLNNKKPFATSNQDKENTSNNTNITSNNTSTTTTHNNHNSYLNNKISSNNNNSNYNSRTPLKSIPISLKDQIQNNNVRVLNNSQNSIDRASKWMKPIAMVDIEKQDMRSILEKRIGDMRKFLDVDQDNITVTDTVDITGFTDFF